MKSVTFFVKVEDGSDEVAHLAVSFRFCSGLRNTWVIFEVHLSVGNGIIRAQERHTE